RAAGCLGIAVLAVRIRVRFSRVRASFVRRLAERRREELALEREGGDAIRGEVARLGKPDVGLEVPARSALRAREGGREGRREPPAREAGGQGRGRGPREGAGADPAGAPRAREAEPEARRLAPDPEPRKGRFERVQGADGPRAGRPRPGRGERGR